MNDDRSAEFKTMSREMQGIFLDMVEDNEALPAEQREAADVVRGWLASETPAVSFPTADEERARAQQQQRLRREAERAAAASATASLLSSKRMEPPAAAPAPEAPARQSVKGVRLDAPDIGRSKSPAYRRPTSSALQRKQEVMDAQQKQKEIEENTERETTKRKWEKRSGGVDRLYNTLEGGEDDDEAEHPPATKSTHTAASARAVSRAKPRGKDVDKVMMESPTEQWRRAEGSKLEGERAQAGLGRRPTSFW